MRSIIMYGVSNQYFTAAKIETDIHAFVSILLRNRIGGTGNWN